MKKLLIIFIVLFVHNNVFAVDPIDYQNTTLSAWKSCIDKIQNDADIRDNMVAKMVGKEPKVVSDKDAQPEAKARLHKIFIETMAKNCDDSFAEIAQQAERDNRRDIPLIIGFRKSYTVATGGTIKELTDGFRIEITPAKDFELYYPKYIGFLVTSQKVAKKPMGSIIKASDADADNLNSIFKPKSCVDTFSNASKKYFLDFSTTSQTYHGVSYGTSRFPGIMLAHNSYTGHKSGWGYSVTESREDSSPIIAYKTPGKSINDIFNKFKNFCNEGTLIQQCPGINIYPVWISGQTPETKFYTKSNTYTYDDAITIASPTTSSYAGSGIATAIKQPVVVISKDVFKNGNDYNYCSTNPR